MQAPCLHWNAIDRNRAVRALVVALATVIAFVVATTTPVRADPPAFDAGSGLPTIGNFSPVTLNGTDQLTAASMAPFVITDDRGLFTGWQVTLLVPNFRNGTGADCSVGATATVSATGLSMNAAIVTPDNGSTDMTGVTATGFADFTVPRAIITAAAGAGAGAYDVAPAPLRLLVPANAFVGAYCSQATIAIISGP